MSSKRGFSKNGQTCSSKNQSIKLYKEKQSKMKRSREEVECLKKKYEIDSCSVQNFDDFPLSKRTRNDSSPDIASTETAVHELPLICCEDDLSNLAAKQIKAQMMGYTALAIKLKIQLDDARKVVKEKGFAKQPSEKDVVILSKIDARGRAQPLQTAQDKISDYKVSAIMKKYKQQCEDLDVCSAVIADAMGRTRTTSLAEVRNLIVEVAEKNGLDITEYLAAAQPVPCAAAAAASADRSNAEEMNLKAIERCTYCFDQPQMQKHLVIDEGNEVYISIPNYQTITEGHCLIIPKRHVSSMLSLDENEWNEVNDFKNRLRRLCQSCNRNVIFLETSMNYRYFSHAVLECIPVSEVHGYIAPFHFKKAIEESETEWALNKKLIDLSFKGLKRSVPSNLPYFHVQFDPNVHAGYAHVIEDEKYFPPNFGKEIICGMLGIDYNCLYKNKKDGDDLNKKCKEVVEFQKKWKRLHI